MKFSCGMKIARLIGIAILRICRLEIATCKLLCTAPAISKRLANLRYLNFCLLLQELRKYFETNI